MKDRIIPCMYYTYAHGTCGKGIKDVTLSKCKNCKKYRPRNTSIKFESIRSKRRKDVDRHDNWRNAE